MLWWCPLPCGAAPGWAVPWWCPPPCVPAPGWAVRCRAPRRVGSCPVGRCRDGAASRVGPRLAGRCGVEPPPCGLAPGWAVPWWCALPCVPAPGWAVRCRAPAWLGSAGVAHFLVGSCPVGRCRDGAASRVGPRPARRCGVEPPPCGLAPGWRHGCRPPPCGLAPGWAVRWWCPFPCVPAPGGAVRVSPTYVWAFVPQGGTGGHTGRRPLRRLRSWFLAAPLRRGVLWVTVKAQGA